MTDIGKENISRRAFLVGKKFAEDYRDDEEGATAIEYGLLGALIGVAVIAGARDLGKTTRAQARCTAIQVQYAERFRLGARWQKRCVAVLKRR